MTRASLVDRSVGSVRTGFGLCALAAGGSLDTHVHSFAEFFYILEFERARAAGVDATPLHSCDDGLAKIGAELRMDDAVRRCHVANPRARSVGASGIVRPLRLRSATWSSRQREAHGAFGLRRGGVGR